jgi:hypothetical protein
VIDRCLIVEKFRSQGGGYDGGGIDGGAVTATVEFTPTGVTLKRYSKVNPPAPA